MEKDICIKIGQIFEEYVPDTISAFEISEIEENNLEVYFVINHPYQDLSLDFVIPCEENIESFMENFDKLLDNIDRNELAIKIIRNPDFDGDVIETVNGIQDIHDKLCDIYDIAKTEQMRINFEEER